MTAKFWWTLWGHLQSEQNAEPFTRATTNRRDVFCSMTTPEGRRRVRRMSAVGDGSATPNLSPLQCARSLDFWLLFLVFGTGAGCGILFINNVGGRATPQHTRPGSQLTSDWWSGITQSAVRCL